MDVLCKFYVKITSKFAEENCGFAARSADISKKVSRQYFIVKQSLKPCKLEKWIQFQ